MEKSKNNGVFASRLNEIMKQKKTTQFELSEITGTTRQAVSLYLNGSALPNMDKLIAIAEYFNVSTDYLLGLSEVQSTNAEIKNISNTTGLNENAIVNLIDIKDELNDYINEPNIYNLKKSTIAMVNMILENRIDLNNLAISFYDYCTLVTEDDTSFIGLDEALTEMIANDSIPNNLCVVSKCDMIDYKLYSFSQLITEIVKNKAKTDTLTGDKDGNNNEA